MMIELEYTDIFDDQKVKKLEFSEHLINKPFNKTSLFAILVDGKSMEPLINDRAIIVADLKQKELVDNGIYLVYYENKMWVKRYDEKKKIFFSINPDFSHLVYKLDQVHLVSRVILTFTNL